MRYYTTYKHCELKETQIRGEESKHLSRAINCTDNVNLLWNSLFRDEPSVFEKYSCLSLTCEDYQRIVPTLNVNYNTLNNSGFECLEEAVIFRGISENLYCQNCKKNNLICTRTLNKYIFIELEVPLKNTKELKKCKLQDLPKQINLSEKSLQGDIKQLRYRYVHFLIK